MQAKTLDEWLQHLSTLHPENIELGLSRIREVWAHHGKQLSSKVVTVAGTNGKGSSVALIDSVYRAAGYQVACYTSPHILCFNERIRVNGVMVEDDLLCKAFENIDASRKNVSLTYFEFTTLAALDIFADAKLDLVVLEVGLGGRLDAVNIIDPDVALITTIAHDHNEWLGESLDSIGREKAGILRQNGKAVIADSDIPASVIEIARNLDVDYFLADSDYRYYHKNNVFDFQLSDEPLKTYPNPSLAGDIQIRNAAAVIALSHFLQKEMPLEDDFISAGFQQIEFTGRFQSICKNPQVYVDVAHNVQALEVLKQNLLSIQNGRKIVAVFSMLSDKDIDAAMAILKPLITHWYICSLNESRGLLSESIVEKASENIAYTACDSVSEGMEKSLFDAKERDDIIIAFGSFYVVADAIVACQKIDG